jgi:hypothetical protein
MLLPNRKEIAVEKMRPFIHQLSASGTSEHFLSELKDFKTHQIDTVATRER